MSTQHLPSSNWQSECSSSEHFQTCYGPVVISQFIGSALPEPGRLQLFRDGEVRRVGVGEKVAGESGAGEGSVTSWPAMQPARTSPWYVLATIHGEQTGVQIDRDLHARNRQTWNRWMAAALSDATKQMLIKERGIDCSDLEPLGQYELKSLRERAELRLNNGGELPNPGTPDCPASVDLKYRMFNGFFCAQGFVFPGEGGFSGSKFDSTAIFNRSVFLAQASFHRAEFQRGVLFERGIVHDTALFTKASFGRLSNFKFAVFVGDAAFDGTRFDGRTFFIHATFNGVTNFDETRFGEAPDFRDADLPQSTTWRAVSWPDVPRNVSDAEYVKERYAGLRYAMKKAERLDAELDFFAREMAAKRHTDVHWSQRWTIGVWLTLAGGGQSVVRPLGAWLLGICISIILHSPLDRGLIALPKGKATELLAMILGNALFFGSTTVDRRKLHFLEATFDIHVPPCLQLFDLMHSGFSGLCLFLMALAVRNWLRLR